MRGAEGEAMGEYISELRTEGGKLIGCDVVADVIPRRVSAESGHFWRQDSVRKLRS